MSSAVPHPAAYGSIGGFTENPLLLPGKDPVYAYGTLKSGAVYRAGSVLGIIALGAVSSAAKAGGNTGNGTLTVDPANPKRVGAKTGVYRVRCIAAAANNGTFRVEDPDGFVLGDIVMAGGAGAFDDDIKFTLADGGTDFIVGDGFDVTVAAGSNLLTLASANAEDGSSDPVGILPEEIDATSENKNCGFFAEGYFNETALVLGAGHTADTVRTALRGRGIYIRQMRYSG